MKDKAIVVTHTHWDREWYKPFQYFRSNLVKLIDLLIQINENKEFVFMLDGQTVVLEDYLEIRPELQDKLLELIRKGKILVGPWYLLPDEWLVGGESLIRNLERSYDLSKKFSIPLIEIAYLPDMFGHSRVVPQLITDLTTFNSAVIWRGVGNNINSTVFRWKSHSSSDSDIFTVYLPNGYGNAAHLVDDPEQLKSQVEECINNLREYSPVPLFLLMNGTDHQFPNPKIREALKKISNSELEVKQGTIQDFINEMNKRVKKTELPVSIGEFRSPARAPLLQDTYSSRMWIKQWNQKVEDLLIHYVEPLYTYLNHSFTKEGKTETEFIKSEKTYPYSELDLAWKWLLRNQPHDSICGCSVDQTHNEMISRFSWSETIAVKLIDDFKKEAENNYFDEESIIVFNPTNNDSLSSFFFDSDVKKKVTAIKDEQGNFYDIQLLRSSEEKIIDQFFSAIMLKAGLKMLQGRKINDVFINNYNFVEEEENIFRITLFVGKEPIGSLDINSIKNELLEIVESKKYKKFHVIITSGSKNRYIAVTPLSAWSFNKFDLIGKQKQSLKTDNEYHSLFNVSKDLIENKFFRMAFNSDGSFKLYDKLTHTEYSKLHAFEDIGDRGDEYTFSSVGPIRTKTKKVKRTILTKGKLYAEIKQELVFPTFYELTKERNGRTGKVEIRITTIFKLYRDIPRIDITTSLINVAKDHRLRVIFNIPWVTNETLTSTHFGYIKRNAEPEKLEKYEEQPSGIQPQKRFIRLEDNNGKGALTLINQGLPEVELAEGNKLALTLLRSVGWLSRSDFPERPMHAGPFLPTPDAQELNKKYVFNYSLFIHSKETPISKSLDEAESATLDRITINSKNSSLAKPFIKLDNHWIKISSLRTRNGNVILTLYNLNAKEEKCIIRLNAKVTEATKITVFDEVKEHYKIENNTLRTVFKPLEIKRILLKTVST